MCSVVVVSRPYFDRNRLLEPGEAISVITSPSLLLREAFDTHTEALGQMHAREGVRAVTG